MSLEERDPLVVLFDTLFETHRRALYAFHLGRTGDTEAAADLLQETFVRVWRNIRTLAGYTHEEQRFWLFRVARNLTTDYHRRASPATETLDETVVIASCSNPVHAVETHDMAARVQAAITQLPTDLRVVLVMQVMGDLNSTQIGRLLERPSGTVRYQLSQARRQLAERLKLELA